MNISTLRHLVTHEPGAGTAHRETALPANANANATTNPDRGRFAALVAALALITILLLASLDGVGTVGASDKPGDTAEPAVIVSVTSPAPVVVAP